MRITRLAEAGDFSHWTVGATCSNFLAWLCRNLTGGSG